MQEINCQLLVIGSGPGGYVCAIRAGQLGIDTVIVDYDKPGGTCLNVGCIPSKALIHVADQFEHARTLAGQGFAGITSGEPALDLSATTQWKDSIVSRLNRGVGGLLKKAGVRSINGRARFIDGKTVIVDTADGEVRVRMENAVIATGSEPTPLAAMPFGGNVISSSDALSLTELPESLAVVGGGYIGLELGIAMAKLGARVSVIEAQASLLSQYDAALVKPVMAKLKALNVNLHLSALARSFDGEQLQIEMADGSAKTLQVHKVLVAVGRRPMTDGWGREELVLDMEGPFVQINDQCKTNMRGIYAIGDVTGEPMLAHRAMAQGEMVAELVAGKHRRWDKMAIPAVCFTDPEIVSVGVSASQAKEDGIEVVTGSFPFAASGRAMATNGEHGAVHIVARADNHLVIGLHAVGESVSELSAAMSLALEMGCRLEDVAQTIHAHPTRSEGLAEAAMGALGHALHT